MAQKSANDVTEVLRRAKSDTKPRVVQPEPQRVRKQIYNGDPQGKTPGYVVAPPNRKPQQKKRRSTFNIVLMLFGIAVGLVAYISNILAVRQLALEVHQLEAQHASIIEKNKLLDAEVTNKAALARIQELAQQRLGMVDARAPEIPFAVDEDKMDEFKSR